MAKRPVRDLTIGATFALALTVVALAVMAIGGDAGLWFGRSEFTTVFADATGLLVGAPVRMAGVQVGTVSQVTLPTDASESGIEVRLAIDPAYAGRVRQDSRAALRILQFLTNEKYVLIEPGSPDSPVLPPGSRIQQLAEVGVVERGEAIADDLGEVTLALKNILRTMESGEGLIGKMLQDPEFGREGLDALRGTLQNMERLTGDIVAGKGTLGRLLHDEELAVKLDSLGSTLDDLAAVSGMLAAREGAVGELLREGGAAELALADLREATASLKRVSERLEGDEGLLGRLLNDPEYSEALAADLESTLGDFAEIAEKINAGEGTLGALINERAVHDGAEDIVAGVNDSKFARWLTRHYRKKGIKARDREGREAQEEEPAQDP